MSSSASVSPGRERTGGSAVGRGVVWNLVQFGGGKLVTFVSTIVLARLLAPSSFGLVAMGLLAINLFDRLKDLGVGAALVQFPGRSDRLVGTGVVLTLVTSVGLAVACLGTAPYLAVFLGDERLTPIVRSLALTLLVSGLAVVPDAMLRRDMHFRQRTAPEVSGAAVKALVSIALAFGEFGVWSLVWGQVAAALTTTTGYWWVHQRLHGRSGAVGWDTAVARRLLRFGGAVSWIALLALVLDNIDYFVVGRRLGAEQLGYYTMAFRLPELLVVSVCVVIGQVLYSSFSKLQHDRAALGAQYLSATAAVCAVTVPIGLGLAAAAPEVVDVVLGDQFAPAVPLLRLLGIYGAVYSLSFHAGEVYKAIGRTELLVRISLARLALFLPLLWWAAGVSTVAVAATFLGLQATFTVIRLALVRHVLELSLVQQWRAMRPALLAGALLLAAVVGLGSALPPGLPSPLRLAILVVLGAVLYAGSLRLIAPGLLGRSVQLVRRRGVTEAAAP